MSEINEVVTLTAELSSPEPITGNLVIVDFHLHPLEDSEGYVIVDSQGNILNDFTPEAQVEALHGEITLPDVVVPGAFPGPYTFTATDQEQTIPTQGYYMAEDIIINPVPSNYGLITWDGTTITVS